MRYFISIVVILVIVNFSCRDKDSNVFKKESLKTQTYFNDSVEFKIYYENGNLKERGWKKREKKTDWWFYLYPNGKLSKKEKYDKFCDLTWRMEYDSLGNTIFEGHYSGEKKNGYAKYYFSNGKICKQGNYCNDELEGWWKEFNEKGNIKYEGNFEHSKKNGYFKYYFNNKLESEGTYLNNSKTACWKYYDTSGVFKKVVLYD